MWSYCDSEKVVHYTHAKPSHMYTVALMLNGSIRRIVHAFCIDHAHFLRKYWSGHGLTGWSGSFIRPGYLI